jgi:hypothetical protein
MAFFLLSCYASFMQITLDIPDEVAAQARARGLTPENYVRVLIDDAVRGGSRALEPKRGRRDMQAFFQAMAAYSEKIPQLPDEAFTRESFYQGHD